MSAAPLSDQTPLHKLEPAAERPMLTRTIQDGHAAWLGAAIFMGVAVAAAVLAVLYPTQAGFTGLAVLVGLTLVGAGFLIMLALNDPRSNGQSQRGKMLASAFEGFDDALAVTNRSGDIIFANRGYRTMCRNGGDTGLLLSPELALDGGPAMAARLFRLLRAASDGQRCAADVKATLPGVEGGARWYRVAIDPLSQKDRLSMWRIRPIDEQVASEPSSVVVPLRPRRAREDGEPATANEGGAAASLADAELRAFFANAPVGIALLAADGQVKEANAALASFLGAPIDTIRGGSFYDYLKSDDRDEAQQRIVDAIAGKNAAVPAELRFGANGERIGQLHLARWMGAHETSDVVVYVTDATDMKSLQLQFAQSQKMQAVGQLAGGIAHDFNNILTAIIGFTDILLLKHKAGDPSFGDLMQIKNSGTRASRLVGQLLAFSRRQTLQPKVFDATDLITEMSEMLRRVLGEEVRLVHELGRDTWPMRVDGAQFDNMILNLAVNARHAMPNGGTLTIRTANVDEPASRALNAAVVEPGEYVMIEVSDTGSGIAPDIIGKIFEPFFTTKGVGVGTGLGLSMVYGFIKQSGGYIFPESELGKGTSFKIYLPRHVETAAEQAEAEPEKQAPRDLTGMGTIMLVEDDNSVRSFASRALTMRGYTVLEADGGDAALDIIRRFEGTIDVLVTDVVMPAMNGPDLVREVRKIKPDMRVIFISGYAEDDFRKQAENAAEVQFLSKPFSLKQLAAKVKDLIEAG